MPRRLRTYLVEDNQTIRENLIATLEDLASVETVGHAATESAATEWLAKHQSEWDLAIVDIFLEQGSGLGVLTACRERQPHQHVIFTGRDAPAELIEHADLVTEMREVKHPYKSGVQAQAGIEY